MFCWSKQWLPNAILGAPESAFGGGLAAQRWRSPLTLGDARRATFATASRHVLRDGCPQLSQADVSLRWTWRIPAADLACTCGVPSGRIRGQKLYRPGPAAARQGVVPEARVADEPAGTETAHHWPAAGPAGILTSAGVLGDDVGPNTDAERRQDRPPACLLRCLLGCRGTPGTPWHQAAREPDELRTARHQPTWRALI
jgi:hypothetical protein